MTFIRKKQKKKFRWQGKKSFCLHFGRVFCLFLNVCSCVFWNSGHLTDQKRRRAMKHERANNFFTHGELLLRVYRWVFFRVLSCTRERKIKTYMAMSCTYNQFDRNLKYWCCDPYFLPLNHDSKFIQPTFLQINYFKNLFRQYLSLNIFQFRKC